MSAPRVREQPSRAPLVGSILIALVAIAGVLLLVTHDGGGSDEAASSPAAASTTTRPQEPVTSTRAPEPVVWSTTTDPRSGLSWRMPGTDPFPMENNVAMLQLGPIGESATTWSVGTFVDDTGPKVQVSIWPRGAGATQADVDRALAFGKDFYRHRNTPYSAELSLAGGPVTAVDASATDDDPGTSWTAAAAVDGALVLIQVYADPGEQADHKVFEEVVASFART